jgi:hypothetical protein
MLKHPTKPPGPPPSATWTILYAVSKARWSRPLVGCVSSGSRLDIVCTLTLCVLLNTVRTVNRSLHADVGNSTMPGDTTKVIATVALGLALYISFVPPPQPAAAADLTKEHFDEVVAQLSRDIGREIRDNNRDLAEAIADAVRRNTTTPALRADALDPPRPGPLGCAARSDCRPPHHHVPTRVLVVEKVVHVAPRPHGCCRPPPPRPCPPEWGWYY